jgi:ABC-type branched-subunit amino acid transport system permease subunit
MLNLARKDLLLLAGFVVAVLAGPIIMTPLGLDYPDILQKFAIFGIFAIGFNILFGLTGYLSFGHAAFLGVGSYTTVWTFKLFSMNPLPAILFAAVLTRIIHQRLIAR